MNGYRRFGVSVLAAFAAAALALGVGWPSSPVGSARAAPAPEFTLEFAGLEPGVPQTDVGTFSLDRAADLVAFEWLEQVGVLAPGAVAIDMEACDSAGSCVDPRTIAGPVPFAAGTGSVTVTVGAGRRRRQRRDRLARRPDVVRRGGRARRDGIRRAPWLAAGIAGIAVGALVFASRPSTRRRRATMVRLT